MVHLKPSTPQLKSFATESSFHGIIEITHGTSLAKRIAWAILFIASLVMLGYEIGNIVKQYINDPYATVVDTSEMVHFPIIGFCTPETIDPHNALDTWNLTAADIQDISSALPDHWSGMDWGTVEYDMAAPAEHVVNKWNLSMSTYNKIILVFYRVRYVRSNFKTYSDMLKNLSFEATKYLQAECTYCQKSVPKLVKYVKSMGVCYLVDAGEVVPARDRGRAVPELRISLRMSADEVEAFDKAFNQMKEDGDYTYDDDETDVTADPSVTDYTDYTDENATDVTVDPSATDDTTEYYYYEKRRRRQTVIRQSRRPVHNTRQRRSAKRRRVKREEEEYYYYDDDWMDDYDADYGGEVIIPYKQQPSFRIMIGAQAKRFDDLGDIRLDENMDATILINIVERRLIYEEGKCIPDNLKGGIEQFTPCVDQCVNEDLETGCGIKCQFYLGEIYEQKFVKEKGVNMTVCKPYDVDEEGRECIKRITKDCDGKCLQQCNYFFYEPSVIPSDTKSDTMGIAMDMIIRPLHPESLIKLIEVPTYTWDTLLSNVGGMLGLFCGASILSVVHLISFCICGPALKNSTEP